MTEKEKMLRGEMYDACLLYTSRTLLMRSKRFELEEENCVLR